MKKNVDKSSGAGKEKRPEHQKRKKRIIMAAVFVALVAAAWILGGAAAKNAPIITQHDEDSEAVAVNATRVGMNCKLTTVYSYELCGHTFEQSITMPEEYVGMTERELKQELGNVKITRFKQTEVRLQKMIDQYCDKHYILKLEDGALYIMRNEPGTAALYRESALSADVSNISAADKEKLVLGIVFGTKAEAISYSETLTLHN